MKNICTVLIICLVLVGCRKDVANKPNPVFVVDVSPPYFNMCECCKSFSVDNGSGQTNHLSPITATNCIHKWNFVPGKIVGTEIGKVHNLFRGIDIDEFEKKALEFTDKK